MASHSTDRSGLSTDAGWEVGARQVVPLPVPVVWEYLLGEGLPFWLGETELPREKGAQYATADGLSGTILRYTEGSKVRLSWHPDDWPHETILQLAVKAAEAGTTIAIQHENLADREERKLMLGHWKGVLAQLARQLEDYPR